MLGNTTFDSLTSDMQSVISDDETSETDLRRAQALNYAGVTMDGQRDRGDQVGLSAGQVQTFLTTLTGGFVDPANVTDDVVNKVNNQVGSAANGLPSDTVARNRFDLIDGYGYSEGNDARQAATLESIAPLEQLVASEQAATATRETASLDINSPAGQPANAELLSEMKRGNEIAIENNRLMRDAAKRDQDKIDAANQTAENTRPRPSAKDPSTIQRAAAADAASRSRP